MKINLSKFTLSAFAIISLLSIGSIGTASAISKAKTAASSIGSSTSATQTAVQAIISKGDAEIERRLTTLNSLSSKISSSSKISAADKASLTDEVNSEISGLNSLKTTLDGSTTIASAKAAAQSIFNDYRVYALIVPKISLMQATDNQQLVEARLATLETNLGTRINSTTNASLQGDLASMITDTQSAQALSSSVETSVVGLQPSDYNSDHTLLIQYFTKLKTALADNQTAAQLGKTIVSSLTSSK
ncbi:MAG TPA: hypothetical protein VIH90_05430 [Candidatus Saccharimonadales bacterium]